MCVSVCVGAGNSPCLAPRFAPSPQFVLFHYYYHFIAQFFINISLLFHNLRCDKLLIYCILLKSTCTVMLEMLYSSVCSCFVCLIQEELLYLTFIHLLLQLASFIGNFYLLTFDFYTKEQSMRLMSAIKTKCN